MRNITPNPNKRSVELREMRPDEEQNVRDLFRKAMEKRLITWVPIDGAPLTIQEYGSLLNELTESVSLSETGAKIEDSSTHEG